MSIATDIWGEIKRAKLDGKLHMIRPIVPGEVIVRPMLVVPEIWKVLNFNYDNSIDTERAASLQADLEVFVTGAPIDPSYLKRLSPKGKAVWEIKSKRPRPSIRIFGRFADRDVFIATNYGLRAPMGPFQSLEWKGAIHDCRQLWNQLFTNNPINGELHQLVTGAING